jgi:hypothetical protein
MWRKEERQQSFAEQEVYAGAGSNRRLEEIAGLLDWGATAPFCAVLGGLQNRCRARPRCPWAALATASRRAAIGAAGALVDGVVTFPPEAKAFLEPLGRGRAVSCAARARRCTLYRLRWRRSPRAYRAMVVVAACYLLAGSLLGAWVLHLAAPKRAEVMEQARAVGIPSIPTSGFQANGTTCTGVRRRTTSPRKSLASPTAILSTCSVRAVLPPPFASRASTRRIMASPSERNRVSVSPK